MERAERAIDHVSSRAAVTAGLSLLIAVFAASVFVLTSPAHGAQSRASISRTIALSENAQLHLTSHHGFTLNEKGSASGTINGVIYIHLNVASVNHVTAEVNIYPSGGSLTGSASANYHPSGGVATFNGTMNITRGSGSFSHARGSGLSFSGTIQRTNDAASVHVSGRISA
jgi:hypothetical protein